MTAVVYRCAAQGGTSALQAEMDSSPTSSNSNSSTFFSRDGFLLLAAVCAINTVAILVLLACWVRRRQRMRDDDVISVASEVASEPNTAQSWFSRQFNSSLHSVIYWHYINDKSVVTDVHHPWLNWKIKSGGTFFLLSFSLPSFPPLLPLPFSHSIRHPTFPFFLLFLLPTLAAKRPPIAAKGSGIA